MDLAAKQMQANDILAQVIHFVREYPKGSKIMISTVPAPRVANMIILEK